MTVTDELIQKVASGQEVLLVEMRGMRHSHSQLSEDLSTHRRDDREDFNRVFAVMENNRKDRSEQFALVIEAMVKRMDLQDQALAELRRLIAANERVTDRARGAGWAIIGVVSFLGTALLVVLAWGLNHIGK